MYLNNQINFVMNNNILKWTTYDKQNSTHTRATQLPLGSACAWISAFNNNLLLVYLENNLCFSEMPLELKYN